jgi:hypothetical protein
MTPRVPVACATALLAATASVAAQDQPLRLTFGGAVAWAAAEAPTVAVARLRGDAADARARQASAALWPSCGRRELHQPQLQPRGPGAVRAHRAGHLSPIR